MYRQLFPRISNSRRSSKNSFSLGEKTFQNSLNLLDSTEEKGSQMDILSFKNFYAPNSLEFFMFHLHLPPGPEEQNLTNF